MEDFDPDKTVDEYDFNLIFMWIRVFGLPLGQMNRATGERIGADFHELVEVDVGPDGNAIGKYLRVKVRLDIQEPLMRDFVLDRDKKGEEEDGEGGVVGGGEDGQKKKKGLLWCRFEYEYMPDFCYTCGVIRHGEKECRLKPPKGEAPQYGPWLRVEETHHMKLDVVAYGKGQGSRSFSGSESSQERRRKYGWGSGSRGSESNVLSWRKEEHAS